MKIILACAAGMSTSMLVDRMKESAEKKGIPLEIEAIPVSSLDAHLDGVQLVLLGPQVSYLEEQLAASSAPVPVRVVDMMDYGLMNGEKVLLEAINIIES